MGESYVRKMVTQAVCTGSHLGHVTKGVRTPQHRYCTRTQSSPHHWSWQLHASSRGRQSTVSVSACGCRRRN